MTTLFYLLVLFFIAWEFNQLLHTKKSLDFQKTMLEDIPSEQKLEYSLKVLGYAALTIIYWIVVCLGIIKSHFKWEFGAVLLLSFLHTVAGNILKKHFQAMVIYKKMDAILTILILSYIIYLKYLV